MIRARAAVVAAIGGVEYKLPVASVSYILIAASAYQDTSGLYQYKTEFATVADQAIVSFAKAVADGVSTAEAIQNFVLEKGITDEVVLTETINILITIVLNLESSATVADAYANLFETIKTETVTAADGSVWSIEKNVDETVSATEVYVVDLSKPQEETLSVADASVVDYDKPQIDAVTSDDSFSRVAEFVRDFDEPQTIAEDKSVDFNKPIFDLRLIGTLNEVQLNVLAVNSDYLESNEYVYLSDSLSALLELQRSVSDSISTPTDALTSDVGKQLADDFGTADSLSYVIQSYNPDLANSRVLNLTELNSSY